VYTADTTDPALFWQNPGDGQVVDARSINITVSSSDDHAVRSIDLYIDGSFVATTACDNVTYICQLSHSWSASSGSHTATFTSHDWMTNTGSLSVSFSVGGTAAKTSTMTSTMLATPTSDNSGDVGHGRPADAAGSKGKSSEHKPTK
jgi:hypothetical protein